MLPNSRLLKTAILLSILVLLFVVHSFVCNLAGLGGEQFIELGVFREVIRKGQDDIVEEQQPVARLGVGHIGKLLR